MTRPLRLAGWALLAVAVAGWLALVEVFWLPWRVGGVLVPVSVPAAVVGNLVLVSAAHRLTGSRVVAALPALVWLAVALGGSVRRPEGDLLIAGGNGATTVVSLAFLLGGVVAASLAVGRVLGTPPARSPVRPAGAGGGSGGAR